MTLELNELLADLNYQQSPHYRTDISQFEPETAHLFRAVQEIGDEDNKVDGVYVFKTSPTNNKILADRPSVFVAKAQDLEQARNIHKSLWNLGNAPFIVILLPSQVRIYTGFDYDKTINGTEKGYLGASSLEHYKLLQFLTDLSAEAIDSGRIWSEGKYVSELNTQRRVDTRLLRSLEQLGDLLKKRGLKAEIANALIGKYVYIRYLRDREIISDAWLRSENVDIDEVLGRNATVKALAKLVSVLEERFNGKIFPIDFDNKDAPKDEHVQLTAAIFNGDNFGVGTQQLHLDFQAYDFRYIPIELLSAVYEQFIQERKAKGAIYTPEILADYVLSEVQSVKPLTHKTKILDPACGSGVFLVLAYRRLIEEELAKFPGSRLSPAKLKSLLENIYGVEREQDACYVAEFSLILTLLSYLIPPDLAENPDFRFPTLHNKHIFNCDFFDLTSEKDDANFWRQNLKFDWIVGNPPWIRADKNSNQQQFAHQWIINNSKKYPMSHKKVEQAFSWLVTELLTPNGVVGLILYATNLFNFEAKKFRRAFFSRNTVYRITNFANLRHLLFDGRTDKPAATFIYSPNYGAEDNHNILHLGPFLLNQLPKSKITNQKDSHTQDNLWAFVINENEMQLVPNSEAQNGDTLTWKIALWGTHFDKRAIERIAFSFPNTIKGLQKNRNWYISEGSQLRVETLNSKSQLVPVPEYEGKKEFSTKEVTESLFRYSLQNNFLKIIPKERCFVRKQGGTIGLKLTPSPHIILSPSWRRYLIYSDEDFVIPPRQIGIATFKEDSDLLRTLAIYLSSSLLAYYLFFQVPEWGIDRYASRVLLSTVKNLPVPNFTSSQILELAAFHRELVNEEKQRISNFVTRLRNGTQTSFLDNDISFVKNDYKIQLPTNLTNEEKKQIRRFKSTLRTDLQTKIDEKIYSLLRIPDDIRFLVEDFIDTRLPLDNPARQFTAKKIPTDDQLLQYAKELRQELDGFVSTSGRHRVTITRSEELIECLIEIGKFNEEITSEVVKQGDKTKNGLLNELKDALKEQVSQWSYVQRSLRLFNGPYIYIYKLPRLLDWTRSQALNDASDIIGQVLAMT